MSHTIAAVATANAPAAIGVVRLSGPDTAAIVDKIFRPKNGKPITVQEPRRMVYGLALDASGEPIDDALCCYFPAPNSYTGEDSAELHCHGAPVVLSEVLSAAFHHGARQATGGEFTRRAFLNGRMDLLQAESVVDLIDAETAQQAKNALTQLGGALSRQVNGIYDDLMALISRFYAVVDYPDEDIEDVERTDLLDTLRRAENDLDTLLATFSRGQLLKNGIPVVILGKPNVGKSSLLNALLGYDRAIVTPIAGTTRDTVEEKVKLGDLLLRLIDTAGLRHSGDTVERLGVERSRKAAAQASLALLVLDTSRPLDDEDEEAIALAQTVPNLLVVANKSDLPSVWTAGDLADRFDHVLTLSADTQAGMDVLTEAVCALYPSGAVPAGGLLTNTRQAEAVGRALKSIRAARASLHIGMTPDVVLTDAEAALAALGELNGKNIREDMVATIFSRFCVGK